MLCNKTAFTFQGHQRGFPSLASSGGLGVHWVTWVPQWEMAAGCLPERPSGKDPVEKVCTVDLPTVFPNWIVWEGKSRGCFISLDPEATRLVRGCQCLPEAGLGVCLLCVSQWGKRSGTQVPHKPQRCLRNLIKPLKSHEILKNHAHFKFPHNGSVLYLIQKFPPDTFSKYDTPERSPMIIYSLMNPSSDPCLVPHAHVSQKKSRAGGESTVEEARLCPTHPQSLVSWGCSGHANEKINQSMNKRAKRWRLLVEYQFQGGLSMSVRTRLDCRMWEVFTDVQGTRQTLSEQTPEILTDESSRNH